MENNVIISIVVPVYKVEAYLDDCVKSILAQTQADFELILVDDGSPDRCGAMCDAYAESDDRIKVIHKKNGGLSDARNAGIDIAKGQYITFIDSDDWISERYLEELLNTAQKYDADIVQCDFTSDPSQINEGMDRKENVFTSNREALVNYLTQHDVKDMAWGKLYRLMLFDEIRYPFGKIHEDYLTTYKLLWNARIVVCFHSKLYYYRINPQGIIHGKLTAESFWMHDIVDQIEDYIGAYAGEVKYELSYFRMRCDMSIYNMYLRSGQEKEFREEMEKIREYLKKKHVDEQRWETKYRMMVALLRKVPRIYGLLVRNFR